MGNAVFAYRCDWCGGELESFPQAESGLRCKQCWRTEGNDDGDFSIKGRQKANELKAKNEAEKI